MRVISEHQQMVYAICRPWCFARHLKSAGRN